MLNPADGWKAPLWPLVLALLASCTCAPSAPEPDGAPARAARVPDRDPLITSVRLHPQAPGPEDVVVCELHGEAAERDPAIRRILWTVDEVEVARGKRKVDLGALGVKPGQVLRCTVAPVKDEPVPSDSTTVRPAKRPWEGGNLLVLLADDVGIDKIGAYEAGSRPPETPEIDRLAARGVRFDHAYAMPVCSPTRATLLTGRQPRRTGVGTGINLHADEPDLSLDELTLPERLTQAQAGYSSAAVGKWHLVSARSRVLTNPTDQGFDHFRGSLSNLQDGTTRSGEDEQSYLRWQKVTDGHMAWTDVYATTASVEDTLELAASLPEPWLIYVAFHAAHTPTHVPPSELARTKAHPSEIEQYDAQVRSLDAAVGQIVRGLGDAQRRHTTVVFLGDNGTPEFGIRGAGDGERGKGSLQESGVQVPLIISGPVVVRHGARVQAPVQVADVFATLAELAGVDPDGTREDGTRVRVDGSSLVPYLRSPALPALRPWAYTELYSPSGCLPRGCTSDRRAVYGEHGVLAELEGGESLHPLGGQGDVSEAERVMLREVAWLLRADLEDDTTR